MLKQKVLYVIFILVLLSSVRLQAQSVEVIKFPDLQEIIQEPGEQVKVINFWATWCRPCIKELPHFEALQEKHDPRQLKVYLINLDDVEKLDSRVKPFVEKQDINSTVKLLDETDYNSFIDKVDPQWSGAIPATLIIAGKERRFIEGELSADELEKIIQEVTNL